MSVDPFDDFGRGWEFLARGDFRAAAVCFAAAAPSSADDGRTLFALGYAQWLNGERHAARSAFRAARRELNGRTGPLRAFALERAQAGSLNEAVALLRAVVAIRPKWPIARAEYGGLLLRVGRAEQAARQAAFLLRARVRLADAWRLQAVSAFSRRRFAEAAQAFGELSRTMPSDYVAAFAHARALALAGDAPAARAAAQRAVELSPQKLRARLLLSRIALEANDAAQARGQLRAAVQLAPFRADLRAKLAALLAENAQHKAALDMAAAACQIDADCFPARLVIARCLVEQGRTREAMSLIDELARAIPGSREITELRERIAPRKPTKTYAVEGAAAPTPPFAAGAGAPVPGLAPIGLLDHLDIVNALLLRGLRLKYRKNPFGVAIELLRPSLVVVAHYYLFYATMRTMPGHMPIAVFVLAGFSVWFAFNAVEEAASHGATYPSGAMALPGIRAMHLRAASALWPLLFNLCFCLLALGPLDLYGADLPLPSPPLTALVFLIVAVMGFGLGLTLEGLEAFWPAFKIVGKLLTWVLFVSAGLYFSLADTRPPLLAEVMVYNPLLHLIEYQRSAFVPGYPTAMVTLSYPAEVGAALLAFGLLLLRCARTTN